MGLFSRKADWRETGEMPDPKKVKPDAINVATGRPHSMDAELYAARDASVAAQNARREAVVLAPKCRDEAYLTVQGGLKWDREHGIDPS